MSPAWLPSRAAEPPKELVVADALPARYHGSHALAWDGANIVTACLLDGLVASPHAYSGSADCAIRRDAAAGALPSPLRRPTVVARLADAGPGRTRDRARSPRPGGTDSARPRRTTARVLLSPGSKGRIRPIARARSIRASNSGRARGDTLPGSLMLRSTAFIARGATPTSHATVRLALPLGRGRTIPGRRAAGPRTSTLARVGDPPPFASN